MSKKIETVGEYIAAAPKWAQPTLRELRKAIKAAAPKAKESISYHMPYYSQNGRLAYFGVHTKHCSFYWVSAKDKKDFAKELAKATVVASTIRIPQGEKVPVVVIKKMVKARVKDNEKKQSSKVVKKKR